MSQKSINKVLLFAGRDDWQKDSNLNHLLVNYTKRRHLKIAWEDPAGGIIYNFRSFESKFKTLPSFVRKLNLRLAQALYTFIDWSYFTYLYRLFKKQSKKNKVKLRCEALKKRIQKLSIKNEVIIISRSSGGRVSSLIADELNIKHIICLGYPFQNPDNGAEPERYLHLENIKTPMLIIQGTKDEYGGAEIKDKYKFSPSVEVFFVETNHNFIIDDRTWDVIYQKIDEVIG